MLSDDDLEVEKRLHKLPTDRAIGVAKSHPHNCHIAAALEENVLDRQFF